MLRIDEQMAAAPLDACFRVAADVERWPEFLPHYRWVRFRERQGFARGTVEMAAWRPFGMLRYPTWWVSRMDHDLQAPAILYRHIEGITRGMDVRWEFERRSRGTLLRVLHEWDGPAWPLVGRLAASAVIGPHFISAIARRTLAGIARAAERAAWSAPRM
ncbi:MAG: hypothetical protein HY704_09795 [Gemmatimonadetes bacterium]|nr:hypothetical protein [Gemmatimonadota bacterium]